ncbi:MAG: M20 family metallopeptidase [Rhodospirillales bacterium]
MPSPSVEKQTEILNWLDEQRPAMTKLLERVVNIDSGSYNKEGVDAVGRAFEEWFEAEGIPTERVPHGEFGDCIRAHVSGGEGNRPVLLMGHRDTVFPDGEAERRPFRIEGDIAYGPGVADMKAGLVMNAFVLAAFKRFGGSPYPLIGLYTSDEEIASPSSRPVIEDEARNARVVFNAEPGRESGNAVIGRKGASFFKIKITGTPAHSGVQHEKGISAIGELAAKITELHKLTDYDIGTTVNVGIVNGGNAVNMVAPNAEAQVDVRFKTMESRDAVWERITEILETAYVPGTETEITESRGFLPLTQSPESRQMFDVYTAAGADVGLTIGGEFTGGSADSGFTAQVGAPTVCGTGPVGGRAHTPEEFMRLDTMVPRAKTVALAIMRLSS